MSTKEQIESAEKSFERILSFFSRVESRSSVLFAIDTAMLAFLASNMPPLKTFTEWYMFIVFVPVILIIASIWFVYNCNFPKLKGGTSSLQYFREISKRTQKRFIAEFKNQSEIEYLDDLLSQIWRNSEILTEKFDYLKFAFFSLALAIIPWIISLSLFFWKNNFKINP